MFAGAPDFVNEYDDDFVRLEDLAVSFDIWLRALCAVGRLESDVVEAVRERWVSVAVEATRACDLG